MLKKKVKSIITRQLTRSAERFSGIHDGESCYIFGDGPSVKWFDLTCFADHPAICCNLLPFHKDFNKLDVRYCTMIEPWIFAPGFLQPRIPSVLDFRRVVKEYKSIIKNNPDKYFFVHASNWLSLRDRNVEFMFSELPKRSNTKDDLLRQFELFGGSFHAALTLAYYLGFTKIYLVGFDGWTIQPARANHWYEYGEGEFFEQSNFADDFLKSLQELTDIYTISYDGHSCNVNNINYLSYTGKTPAYKENNELLTENYLNVLGSYPGYKMKADDFK